MAAKLTGGSKRTAEFAARQAKPFIHLSQEADGAAAAARPLALIYDHGIRALSVAGSRASKPTGPTRDGSHHLPKAPRSALARPGPGPSCAGQPSWPLSG
jgi:hypothetical protein